MIKFSTVQNIHSHLLNRIRSPVQDKQLVWNVSAPVTRLLISHAADQFWHDNILLRTSSDSYKFILYRLLGFKKFLQIYFFAYTYFFKSGVVILVKVIDTDLRKTRPLRKAGGANGSATLSRESLEKLRFVLNGFNRTWFSNILTYVTLCRFSELSHLATRPGNRRHARKLYLWGCPRSWIFGIKNS